MKNLPIYLLLTWLCGASASAVADVRLCTDMYPVDAYEAEDRKALIQDCLAAYAPEPDYQQETSEPNYYEGTVEDFVNEIPEPDNSEE